MKKINNNNFYIKNVLIIVFSLLFLFRCADCTNSNVKTISDLKNNQSIIGMVRNCGATTSYRVIVSFKKDNYEISDYKAEICRMNNTDTYELRKISKDTVVIFGTLSSYHDKFYDSELQVDEMNGIHFIYKYYKELENSK